MKTCDICNKKKSVVAKINDTNMCYECGTDWMIQQYCDCSEKYREGYASQKDFDEAQDFAQEHL